MYKYFLLLIAFFSTGCSNEPELEANKVTCSNPYYNQVKSKIKDEVSRKNFEEECDSLKLADKVTDWKFVPSKESKY